MEEERKFKFKKLIILAAAMQSCKNVLNICNVALQKMPRVWTLPIYSQNEREIHGFFNNLFLNIKINNSDEFKKFTRMGVPQFNLLHSLLEGHVAKQDFIRMSIPSECRLAITLAFLGHGASPQILAWAFRVGVSTVRGIVYETCKVIWDVLSPVYLAPPNERRWEKISEDFFESTGMPHVVGAIDGKHIAVKCPPNSGSLYFNYKQYFSIVLLAACDSNYAFIAVDIGAYGSQSDGGVLKASAFGKQILQGTLNIPNSKELLQTNVEFPYYFVGDSAFPLRNNIMRPYPGRALCPEKEHFNKQLSRARVRIENTFGVMTARWRVLLNTVQANPKNVEIIVKGITVLHNYVINQDNNYYCPQNFVDQYTASGDIIPGEWRQGVRPLTQARLFTRFNATRTAFSLRDMLKDYLYAYGN